MSFDKYKANQSKYKFQPQNTSSSLSALNTNFKPNTGIVPFNQSSLPSSHLNYNPNTVKTSSLSPIGNTSNITTQNDNLIKKQGTDYKYNLQNPSPNSQFTYQSKNLLPTSTQISKDQNSSTSNLYNSVGSLGTSYTNPIYGN